MQSNRAWRQMTAAIFASLLAVTATSTATIQPAMAHHPFGGETPRSIVEGFLSGLGHPVIGLDHLAFIVAIGAISIGQTRGWVLLASFLAATIGGTSIHLQEWYLPAPELVISISVLLFGILILSQQVYRLSMLAAIAALAGMFHGYAYGEAVVGAEPTPLFAYLVGFTIVQVAVALASGKLLRTFQRQLSPTTPTFPAAVALGGIVAGVGIALTLEIFLA